MLLSKFGTLLESKCSRMFASQPKLFKLLLQTHFHVSRGHFGNVFECEPSNGTATGNIISITALSIADPLAASNGFHQNNVNSKTDPTNRNDNCGLYAAKVIKKKRAKRSPLGCDLDDIKREYAILVLCNHENICRLHGSYEDEQNVIFVLDL